MKKYKLYIYIVCAGVAGLIIYGLVGGEKKQVINPEGFIQKNEASTTPLLINSAGGKKEMIQVRFSWVVDGITYNDALVISKDQYERLSEEEIEKMKEERVKKWIATVNENSQKENETNE